MMPDTRLAMAGRYDEAIAVLSLAANKQDPRILNYLGYSHRHSGRVTVGLGYYEEALRIDPNYTLVREYLGEAHLQIGDLAGAQQQLMEIEKRDRQGFARIRHAVRADRPFHEELIRRPGASQPAASDRGRIFCCWPPQSRAVCRDGICESQRMIFAKPIFGVKNPRRLLYSGKLR